MSSGRSALMQRTAVDDLVKVCDYLSVSPLSRPLYAVKNCWHYWVQLCSQFSKRALKTFMAHRFVRALALMKSTERQEVDDVTN